MPVNLRNELTSLPSWSNISDEDRAAAERVLNGALGAQLAERLFPQAAVSGLQSQLDTTRSQLQQVNQYNADWRQTYFEDLASMGEAGIARLREAGFDTSGLRAASNGNVQNAQGQQFSQADIDGIVQRSTGDVRNEVQAANARATVAMEYAEFLAARGPEYREMYGKAFDAKGFREFGFANASRYGSLEAAYDAFTADDRKAYDEKQREADRAKMRAEVELEVQSRYSLPEYSPHSEAGGGSILAKANAQAAAAAGAAPDNSRQEFARKWANTDFTSTAAPTTP